MMLDPCRGEIWTVNLDPRHGHEQAGQRPCLVVSSDLFNSSEAGLALIVPLTSRGQKTRLRVEIQPPEAGVKSPSRIMCDHTRSVDKDRFSDRWGMVSTETMREVEKRLRLMLEL